MACSKVFSGDLPELIYQIIKYFQNDYKMLHSCILVNRLWCRLAIPLLWEDPLSITAYNCFNYNPYPASYCHSIEIYLCNLDDDDKIKLSKYGMNCDLFPLNTLFNYPSFIRCLNTQNVIYSIASFSTHYNLSQPPDQDLYGSIFFILLKIFIKSEASLHTFELECADTLYGNIGGEYF